MKKKPLSTASELRKIATYCESEAKYTAKLSKEEGAIIHDALTFYWQQGKCDYSLQTQSLCLMFEGIRFGEDEVI